MESEVKNVRDSRVHENIPDEKNTARIDQNTVNKIFKYKKLSVAEITERLEVLEKEWDIERTLGVNSSSLALTGLILGRFFSKAWYVLPVVVAGLMFQYSVRGWNPPVSLLRRLGFRTRHEIDEEIYALKALRGDFDRISSLSGPVEILASFRM
jgi:hypothetical protein